MGGILINEMNLMSLTRFQIIAWTVMIGSALLAAGLARGVGGVPDALELEIPQQVWELVGISGGAARPGNDDQEEQAAEGAGES